MADVKKRIKDATITLTLAQFLESYVLADSAAHGTGKLIGSHFVLGETEYGGTIVTNFNAISHTGFYTGLSTATGAPNTSYNWFVVHTNSNAGTASAYQMAVAFASTLIVYERVKSGSTWQSWVLRPSFSDLIPDIELETISDAATSALVTVPPDVSDEVSANLPSTLVTLIFVLEPTNDSGKRHQHWIDFSTGTTMTVTDFAVVGPGFAEVSVGNDPSSRVIKFTAAQLNAIYALTADTVLVTATLSVSYAASTHILTVGSETVTLDGAATDDAYFLLGSGFGSVTAVGSIVPVMYDKVNWVSEPDLSASTHYQISVANGMAVIAGASNA